MICRKLSPLRKIQAPLFHLCFLLVFCFSVAFTSFATVDDPLGIVQDAQSETSEPSPLEPDQQGAAADHSLFETEPVTEIGQDEQIDPFDVPSPEYWGDDVESEYYVPFSDSEILSTLKSIEYQLKIVAGAMVLIFIIWFIWLTIYKPIKAFIKF